MFWGVLRSPQVRSCLLNGYERFLNVLGQFLAFRGVLKNFEVFSDVPGVSGGVLRHSYGL